MKADFQTHVGNTRVKDSSYRMRTLYGIPLRTFLELPPTTSKDISARLLQRMDFCNRLDTLLDNPNMLQ